MRARTLILLSLAIILAVGTALLARTWLAAQKTEAELKAVPLALPTPSKSVLVARADIRRGQILRADEMVWQVWPEGGIDKNYVVLGGEQKPDSFAGWVANNPIASGEPITKTKIIKPGNRGFLAAVLRPGMRAISVPVTVTSGISGFIFPGDEVDLMLTYAVPAPTAAGDDKKANYDHKAAQTVLRNIRVIAIDQRLESKAGEAVPAHTATFEVTPKESEVILLASEIGKLSLTLRSLVATPDTPDTAPPGADATTTEPRAVPPAAGPIAAATSPSAQPSTAVSDRTPGSSSVAPAGAAQTVTVISSRTSDSRQAAAPGGGARVVGPSARVADSSVGANATYTLDNEISTLLPQPKGEKDSPELSKFWICKGPTLNCNIQTGGSAGDRFLAAFQELKSQGATVSPGR